MNLSKRIFIKTPIFRKTISVKRFLQIIRFFYLDEMDTLYKMKFVINYFNKKFKKVCNGKEH